MPSQLKGKGRERHRKVLARLLDVLSILFCLGMMSMPSFRFLPHCFVVFLFHCIIMILNEATVKSNHHRWPLFNFHQVQFMIPRFMSHGRKRSVVTRTGPTPVHTGAEAKTQVLYLCEFDGNWPTNMKGFSFPIHRPTQPKNMSLVP